MKLLSITTLLFMSLSMMAQTKDTSFFNKNGDKIEIKGKDTLVYFGTGWSVGYTLPPKLICECKGSETYSDTDRLWIAFAKTRREWVMKRFSNAEYAPNDLLSEFKKGMAQSKNQKEQTDSVKKAIEQIQLRFEALSPRGVNFDYISESNINPVIFDSTRIVFGKTLTSSAKSKKRKKKNI